jgi:tyrosine-protein kinase Etk/Wzc
MKLEAINDEMREPQTADSSPEGLHVLDLLILFARRRRFIALFTLGAALLATIIVLLIPSQYTAETLVMPPAQNSSMSSALLSQLGGSALASVAGAGLGIKNPSEMYISLFRSRTVEDAIIQRFGLMARYRKKQMTDARTAFEDHSTALLGAKDGLIRITVRDRDANLAAEIANAYVDQFRKLSASLAITEASQRRVFFQQQLLEANGNLAAAEEAMKHTEQSTGILQIDSQARSLIESAAALRAQVTAKEVQLQAMRAYATEDNPDVVRATDQLSALQSQLAKLAGNGDDSDAGLIVSKGKAPEASMEYLRKLRDVKYYETITELIAKQFEMAKLDEARQGAIIQVADIAVPPDKRSFPKRTISIILVAVLGFFAACGWCIFADGFQQMKSNHGERRRLDALLATFRKS